MSNPQTAEKTRPQKFSRREMLKIMGTGIAGAVLAACVPATPGASTNPTTPPATGPVDIIFYAYAGTKEIYDIEQAEFNKAQSDVKLNVQYIADNEYDTKLSTLAAGGTLGECWSNYIFGTTYPFAANGIARDLKSYFDTDKDLKLSDIYDAIVKMMTWNGKIICVPFGVHPGFSSWWCNMTDFEQAGLPTPQWEWTYEKEWLDALQKLKTMDGDKVKRYGIAWSGQAQVALTFIRSWGGDWIDPDTRNKATFLDEKTAAGLSFMRDCLVKYQVACPVSQLVNGSERDTFINGGSATYCLGVWELGTLRKTVGDKFKFNGFGMPAGPGGRGAFVGMDSISISSKTNKPDQAWQWAKFETTPATSQRMIAAGNQPGALKSIWNSPPVSTDPDMQHARKWMEVAKPWTVPSNARVVEFRNVVAQQLQRLMDPNNDFQTELKALQDAAQVVLDKPSL